MDRKKEGRKHSINLQDTKSFSFNRYLLSWNIKKDLSGRKKSRKCLWKYILELTKTKKKNYSKM